MIKIKSKTRVILGAALILYSLIQSYRLLTLWYDLNASFLNTNQLQKSEPDLRAAVNSSVANPMALIDGVMPPAASETYSQLYSLAGEGGKSSGEFFAEDAKIEAWLANVPDLDARTRAICDRLPQLLASFPVAAPEPSEKNCYVGALSYVPIRTSARFCALLAWQAARQGNSQQALLAAFAPAAVGAILEIHETWTGALSILGHAIGENIGQLTGSLLRELAPTIKSSKADAIQVLQWSETLEKSYPSPERVLSNELNFWPAFARNWQRAIDNGEAMKTFGRNPHALVALFSDQAVVDSYLVPIMSGFRQVCAEPYPQAIKRLAQVHELARPLKQFNASFGLHYTRFFFMPDTSFMQLLLGTMMPNLDTLYITSVKTRAMLRGGALAVALHAYHNENGNWPADLGEVASWLGVASLPQDPFTAAAWNYNASAPSLLSPGPDLKTGTPDDLQFLKVSH